MPWTVAFHPAFAREYEELSTVVQDELAAFLVYLEDAGPTLRRPYSDTLNGSKHANMKELRFSPDDGVWRVAFAFDPDRRAVILEQFQEKCEAVFRPELRKKQGDRAFLRFEEKRKRSRRR